MAHKQTTQTFVIGSRKRRKHRSRQGSNSNHTSSNEETGIDGVELTMALKRNRASLDLTNNRFAVLLDPTSIAQFSDKSPRSVLDEKPREAAQTKSHPNMPGGQESGSKSATPSAPTSPATPSSPYTPANSVNPSDLGLGARTTTSDPPNVSIAVPILDPRKLVQADTPALPPPVPRSTPDHLGTGTSSLPDVEANPEPFSKTPPTPRLGDTYNPALQRVNSESSHSPKPIRPSMRTSTKLVGREGYIMDPYMARMALSRDPRLARHFPCGLPPAPIASTRRVSNLVAVPPALLKRRPTSKGKPEESGRKASGSNDDGAEVEERPSLSTSSASGLWEEGRMETYRGQCVNDDGSKDRERGAESDWEGLDMAFWKNA